MSLPPEPVKPPARLAAPSSVSNAAPGGARSVAVSSALLEYQSPIAALIARQVPPASHYMIWAIALSFAVVAAAAFLMPINRVVPAAGKVAAITGNLMVQPLDVSLVRSVNVKVGQLVHAGDVLAELDPTFAQADAGALETQVTSLQAEVDRLTAETQNRPYLPDGSPPSLLQAMIYAQRHAERSFKLENYTQQIEAARVKIAQAAADVASFSGRLKLAAEVEAKRRELERLQVGSQLNRLQATDTRMSVDAQLATARSQVASAQRERDGLVAERNSYLQQTNGETSQKLAEQGRLLADARELLNKASLRRHLVQLRAEKDAIVLRVAPVSVGTVMQSGQEFLELVPLDAPLQVNAVMEARDVGFVRVGNPVTIKFDAFPYPLYGTATGRLQSVSPDSFKDPEAPPSREALLKQQDLPASSSFFRARMSIDEVQLHDLPAGTRILPGMPVHADIRIGKRTAIQFMMSQFMHPASDSTGEP